ncbi:hypothetical protein [Haloferax sp. DFSO60]|uniref:DUF7310 family coiled-coil domain-containing protein n=1 Tax=Haloferax sp. DFSO60 TaxID=3388652 RepID=UPI00397E877E
MTDDPSRDTDHSPAASPQPETLSARLDAVERTLTGDDVAISSLEDAAAVESRLSNLETTANELSERMDEVDAATQAVRGYLGGIRAVNEDVERRANAALAKAESLETALIDESASGIDEAAVAEAVDARNDHAPAHVEADDEPVRDDGHGLANRLRNVL